MMVLVVTNNIDDDSNKDRNGTTLELIYTPGVAYVAKDRIVLAVNINNFHHQRHLFFSVFKIFCSYEDILKLVITATFFNVCSLTGYFS